MDYTVYADESGIDSRARCYSIGGLVIPTGERDALEVELMRLYRHHKVTGEAKWHSVSTSYGLLNFGLDVLRLALSGKCRFTTIVVNKCLYRKWQEESKETAFYKTYTFFLKNAAGKMDATLAVYMDPRCDHYPKQDEVVQIISNHMLKNLPSAMIAEVDRPDSRAAIGLQAADMLTGAINCGHDLYLNPDAQVNNGKRLFLSRAARMLGWDKVHYDTYPNPDFNIWHFPVEWRRIPATREIKADLSVPAIAWGELKGARSVGT